MCSVLVTASPHPPSPHPPHPPPTAYYDDFYQAPVCSGLHYACNSTRTLLDSRGTYMTPHEPHNAVNTVFNSCHDGGCARAVGRWEVGTEGGWALATS